MSSHVLCLISITHPLWYLFSFALFSLVLSLFAVPKVNQRNKVGVIVHAVSKIVLGNHTAMIVYGNINYAKTFIQGNIVNVFDGRIPGGEE